MTGLQIANIASISLHGWFVKRSYFERCPTVPQTVTAILQLRKIACIFLFDVNRPQMKQQTN